MGVQDHKKNTPKSVKVGIITLSSTRTLAEDHSGHWISRALQQAGHHLAFHFIVLDNIDAIKTILFKHISVPDIIIMNGGTGISPHDLTIECMRPLFEKELTSFGALFANLSFNEIGSAALLSRATAGIMQGTVIFCIPGSLKACQLACNVLILPELGHLVKHLGGPF